MQTSAIPLQRNSACLFFYAAGRDPCILFCVVVHVHIHAVKASGHDRGADQIADVIERRVRRVDHRPDRRKNGDQSQRHTKCLQQHAGHHDARALDASCADGQDQAEEDELEHARKRNGEAVKIRCKDTAQADDHREAGKPESE